MKRFKEKYFKVFIIATLFMVGAPLYSIENPPISGTITFYKVTEDSIIEYGEDAQGYLKFNRENTIIKTFVDIKKIRAVLEYGDYVFDQEDTIESEPGHIAVLYDGIITQLPFSKIKSIIMDGSMVLHGFPGYYNATALRIETKSGISIQCQYHRLWEVKCSIHNKLLDESTEQTFPFFNKEKKEAIYRIDFND